MPAHDDLGPPRSLKPAVWALGFIPAAFLGGAMLAPLLWQLVHGSPAPLAFLDSHDDFHRFINRAVYVLALLGLYPLLKANGLLAWASIGLPRPSGYWVRLGQGLALGLGSIVLLGSLAGAFLPVSFTLSADAEWGRHLKNALLAMAAVSLLEELLFRGVLFGSLRRCLDWRLTAVFGSLLFAAAHFLDAKPANPENITWLSGLVTLPKMARPIIEDTPTLIRFINLFLAGLILCGLYQRTGNLYCSIGLHAGWILGGKTLVKLTSLSENHASLWWSAHDFLEGALLTFLLLPMAAWAMGFIAKNPCFLIDAQKLTNKENEEA